MKPLQFITSALPAIILLTTSCTQQDNHTLDKDQKQQSVMYEASELALLMRAMHEQSAQWKKNVLNNDSLFIFPEGYNNLHSATATNPAEIGDTFHEKADDFIISAKAFAEANNNERIEKYNLMIASCVDCHRSYCTGPIPKINKLKIE
jgi:hypothetical protein